MKKIRKIKRILIVLTIIFAILPISNLNFIVDTKNTSSRELNTSITVSELWSYPTGHIIWSSPALGDIYGDPKLEVIVGGYDGNIYALNGEDGSEVWTFPMGVNTISSPALGNIDEDKELEVVIGCSNGNLYVIDGKTGNEEWMYSTEGSIISSPSLEDIDDDNMLEVLIGSYDENIYALNGEDGSVLWKYDTNAVVASSPAVGDIDNDGKLDVVVARNDSKLFALNGLDGNLKWIHQTTPGEMEAYMSSPALGDIDGDKKLEIVTGSTNGQLYALNGEDGSIKWTFHMRSSFYFPSPSLGDVNDDGKLDVVISDELSLYALNGEDGNEIWTIENFNTISSPSLGDVDGDGKLEVIIGSNDRHLYALNGEDGTEAWKYKTGYTIKSCPALGDLDNDGTSEVVVGSDDFKLYALKPSSSGVDIKWQGLAGENFHRTRSLSYFLVYKPDFAIYPQNIMISEGDNGSTYIHANLTNLGISYEGDITVQIFDEFNDTSMQIGPGQIINNLSRKEIKTVSVKWTPKLFHNITIVIDPANLIEEISKENNIATKGTGGNTPTINYVWSDYGKWADPNTVGTFLLPIQLNNTFYAEIKDLDGDVDYVEFRINDDVHYGIPSGKLNIWKFEYDMGELKALPDLNYLSIVAYDLLGYVSEERLIKIKANMIPSWILDITGGTIPDYELKVEHEMDVFIELRFDYPPKGSPIKGEGSIPDTDAPGVGGQTSKSSYGLALIIEFSIITGKMTIRGGARYGFELLGYKSEIEANLTGTIDENLDLVEAIVTIGFSIRFPIMGDGPPLKTSIFSISFGLAAEFSIIIETVLEYKDRIVKWASCTITTSGALIGFLRAKVDLGFVGASLKMNLRAGLDFIFGVENGEVFMDLIGNFHMDWSVTWRFLFIKGRIRGEYDLSWEILSPENVNETQGEEPWTFVVNSTNVMDSRPRVAAYEDSKAMMAWTENRFEEEGVYQDIAYSIWNVTKWGEKYYVTYDNYSDFDPALTYDSYGNVMLVWSRITGDANEVSAEDPFALVKTQEIFYSIWNGNSWSTPQPITEDNYANGRAVVSSGNNGEIIAVWVGDADYNFTTTYDMELYYARWDGNSWTSKSLITQNYYMDYSVSLAHNSQGDAILCWIADIDNNCSTKEDRQLLYSVWNGNSWSQSLQVFEAVEDKDTPSITFDHNDNALITWVSRGENITKLYYSSRNKTTKAWSIPEIVHEEAFFIYYPAINVDPNNTAVIVWRGFEDDAAEMAYYLSHNNTETYFDGEICYAVKDLNRGDSLWSEKKFLTSNNKTDWMASAVIIRGHSNDLLLVWDQNGNVSRLVHEIKPDLFVNTTDIKFSNQYPIKGENLIITATVYNIGDVEAKNILVEFYNGNPDNGGSLIGTRSIDIMDYDTKTNITLTWTAIPGINNIYVRVDANHSINELDEDNNLANNSIHVFPDIIVLPNSISFSIDNPDEGDLIDIEAIIYNQGGSAAEEFSVQFFSNDEFIGSKTISFLGVDTAVSISIPWTATKGVNIISVIVDPNNQISEWNETNNLAFSSISILPDLKVINFVVSDDIVITGETISLYGEIQNIGATEAINVSIQMFDGNPYIDAQLLDEIYINLGINDIVHFSFNDWMPSIGVHKVFFVIDLLNSVAESNETNNILYEEFVVVSFPDLTISTPEFEFIEYLLFMNIPIENIGIAGATGIIVKFYDGEPLETEEPIDTRIISNLNAGGSIIVDFFLTAPPMNDDIYIIIDPLNRIKESNESNNILIIHYPSILRVDAGLDQQVDEGELVIFSAILYGETNGDFTFLWEFGDGNTAGNLSSVHRYGDNGTYLATFTATGSNYIATDQLLITVSNSIPIVEAGSDIVINEGEEALFSGNYTDPGYLDTHTINWDFDDGSHTFGTLTPNHIYDDNGVYTVVLTITDDDGGVGTDNMLVLVQNVAPIVDAGEDKIAIEDELLTFSASFSDPGTIDTHSINWDFGDGYTISDTLAPTHNYTDKGDYTVILTVKDKDGAIGMDSLSVSISNVDPIAKAGKNKTVNENGIVLFDGSDSWDTPSDILDLQYYWEFGDNTNGTGMEISHVYTLAGIYEVKLTVIDDDEAFSIDYCTVNVLDITPPTTEIIIDYYDLDDEGNIHVIPRSSFTLVATDISSDISETYYRINNGTWNSYFIPFNLSGPVGNYCIEFFSVDIYGNIEIPKNITVILEDEYKYVFMGYGALRIEGKWCKGQAKLYVSESKIKIEIGDQTASWDILKCYTYKSSEFYYGKGQLGKIYIYVYKCKDRLKTTAFGNGVFFFSVV